MRITHRGSIYRNALAALSFGAFGLAPFGVHRARPVPTISLHCAAFSSQGEVVVDVGLTEQKFARRITGWVAALPTAVPEPEVSERLD